ncbi:MAG: hypothetical protein C5B54_01970 [Acidobacteria bacterium]|nr:MAG: hypothetical protein C5B54_01970 [Acidobacteriota bacterium]
MSSEEEKKKLEAERRRLAYSAHAHTKLERDNTMKGRMGQREVHVKPSTIDAAAEVLRYLVHRCEIESDGLKIVFQNPSVRDIKWNEIQKMHAYRLPPDPPWQGRVFVDIRTEAKTPARIFTTTFVNYNVLPGGTAMSFHENLRRFLAHVLQQNSAIETDEPTREYAKSGRVPSCIPSMAKLAEYDAQFE